MDEGEAPRFPQIEAHAGDLPASPPASTGLVFNTIYPVNDILGSLRGVGSFIHSFIQPFIICCSHARY